MELSDISEEDSAFQQLQHNYLDEIRDDASVALLVFPAAARHSLETYIEMFYNGNTLSKGEILTLLDTALYSAVQGKDAAKLDKLIRFANDSGFVYDKARMVEILEALIQHGFGNAARDLALVIRKHC